VTGIDKLLSRLDKVKKTGNASWKACCPAHRGTKQSLAIRDNNGKILIHCFAEGCAINEVLGALDLTFSDIMPDCKGEFSASKKPFFASDVLQITSDEILVAYLIVKKIQDGTVNSNDMHRLISCASRLLHACEIANGGNGVQTMEKARNQKIIERILNAQ
jgi:hypothetical protein